MFQIFQELHEVRLSDAHNTIHIWPAHGAILNGWTCNGFGENLEVVDGYDSPEDFTRNGEAKGFRSMKLSPFVCRMAEGSYRFDNIPYKVEKFYLGSCAIHGLIYDAPFTVTHTETGEDFASVTMEYHYAAKDPGYPFSYLARVKYTLRPGNSLALETTIVNTGASDIPISDGWHPYFKLGDRADQWQLQMAASRMVEFDDKLLPTGKLLHDTRFLEPASLAGVELDNCFLLDRPGETVAGKLIHPQKSIAIELFPDAAYPYMQVYIPPHRSSIAIENLSSAPDAFNNGLGLIVLEPGAGKLFTAHYRVVENS